MKYNDFWKKYDNTIGNVLNKIVKKVINFILIVLLSICSAILVYCLSIFIFGEANNFLAYITFALVGILTTVHVMLGEICIEDTRFRNLWMIFSCHKLQTPRINIGWLEENVKLYLVSSAFSTIYFYSKKDLERYKGIINEIH